MARCRQHWMLVLGVLSLPGCFPAPVDLSGKRCSPERECGEGFRCEGGLCLAGEIGPPTNQVMNPGFEEGVRGWVATGRLVAEEPGFAGRMAARLESGGSQEPLTLTPEAPPELDAVYSFYCASSWVKGGGDAEARLEILDDGEIGETASLVPRDSWQQLKASSLFTGHEVVSVRVTFPTPPTHPVWVDEVKLWRSSGPLCEDSP